MSLPRRFSGLQRILDRATVHIVVTNPEGRIIYANAAAENHTGFSIAEMMGRTPGDLWGGKMPDDFYRQMWSVIEDERRPYAEDMRNCRKGGEPYWQEVHILPVLNARGGIECYLGIEFDKDDPAEKEAFVALIRCQELEALDVLIPNEWAHGSDTGNERK